MAIFITGELLQPIEPKYIVCYYCDNDYLLTDDDKKLHGINCCDDCKEEAEFGIELWTTNSLNRRLRLSSYTRTQLYNEDRLKLATDIIAQLQLEMIEANKESDLFKTALESLEEINKILI